MQGTVTEGRLPDLWWRRSPRLAGKVSRLFPAVLTDGVYLCAWPAVAGWAPPLALLTGFLIGWLHFTPGETYTYSILILALLMAISSLGAALGAWSVLGYALGDFLLFPHARFFYGAFVDALFRVRAPLLITYVLLAVLLVVVPLTSQGFRRQLTARLPRASPLRTALGAIIQAVFQAALVLVWTHAVPTLIRPIYTWLGHQPPIEAVQPLQQYGIVLVVLAAVLGALRAVLEERALVRPGMLQQVVQIRLAVARVAPRRGGRLPAWATAILKAAFITFMLAGLMIGWLDALAFLTIFTVVILLRAQLPSRLGSWTRMIARVPLLIRIGVGMAISYGLASLIVGVLWSHTQTFLPILISTTASLIVFALLLPGAERRA